MENWINPKIIIGNTAVGDYYFNRPQIVSQIWDEIAKGNHVLLAAPRRVGKSSVMEYLCQNSPEGIKCVFRNIEGIQTEEGFYKKIYELIILCLSQFQKSKNWLYDLVGSVNITEITLEGIKFGEGKSINYVHEIYKILPKLKENDVKIVLFLDELPDILNYLYKSNNSKEASRILDNLRQWRQMPELKQHFCMVLAGSVGIHHVVKMIDGRIADINDLYKIQFEALTKKEAEEYINWATEKATIKYNDDSKNHLLDKISYILPYFINLILDEVNKKAKATNNPNITNELIDKAFDSIVKHSDHFVEWKNRLFNYFPNAESDFMNKVLIHIAHKNKITIRKLYDLAVQHQRTKDYIELMDGLERDGYITEQAESYVFVSPFLKAFWKRTNPVYDGK